MHPTRDIDEPGGRPIISPSSTATAEWPAADTIRSATVRKTFAEASSKPLTVTLSQRMWKGLSLGAPFADRSLGQPADPSR